MRRASTVLLVLATAGGAFPVAQEWTIRHFGAAQMDDGIIESLIAALTAAQGRLAEMAGCDDDLERAITSLTESLGQNPIDTWWFADEMVRTKDDAQVFGAHDDQNDRIYIRRSLYDDWRDASDDDARAATAYSLFFQVLHEPAHHDMGASEAAVDGVGECAWLVSGGPA